MSEIIRGHNSPRVGIGLPLYNAERYVEQALDSIIGQTFDDYELIISDNASTDRTAEICRDYAARDTRIRYYRNDRDLGVATNFNRVFELWSGEYFKWAPCDDVIAPTFLSRAVEVLDERPEIALCYAKAKIIDEGGAFVADHDPGPDTQSRRRTVRFRNLILHPQYAVQMMGVIRSSVLRGTGLHGRFPSSDEILLAEIALRGEFFEIAERLYYYRRHRFQSTFNNKQRDRMLFFDPSRAGKVALPKWLYFFACLQAVRRAPLPLAEQAACYLTILRWLAMPAHWRAMGMDIVLAARGLVAGELELGRGGRASTVS